MFDFEGRIKQREIDKAAKQDEAARRRAVLDDTVAELYAQSVQLVESYVLPINVEKHNHTVRLRHRDGNVLDIDVLDYPDGPAFDFETMRPKTPGMTRVHIPGKTRVGSKKEIADVVLDWCGI